MSDWRELMKQKRFAEAANLVEQEYAAGSHCEVKCGESTGGAEFEFAPQTLISEDHVLSVRTVLLDEMGEAETAVVSIKSAAYKLLHHNPPDLYLFNSTFLI